MDDRADGGSAEVAATIRQFVLRQFPLARRRTPTDEDSLLDSGIVDSLGILELVQFVTGEFEVTVTDEDLVPENFGSIASLTAFVERRAASRQRA